MRRSPSSLVIAAGSLAALLEAGCLGQVQSDRNQGAVPSEDGGDENSPDPQDAGTGAPDGSSTTVGDGDGDGDGDSTIDPGPADASVPVPEGSVAVVVALGHGGRSTISCDDGATWILNRDEVPAGTRCWGQPDNALSGSDPLNIECDHSAGHTTDGLFYHGAFFRVLGWGTPTGKTQRSTNGVDWTAPNPGYTQTYLNLVNFNDSLISVMSPSSTSTDDGKSWKALPGIGSDLGHLRVATVSGYAGGSLVFMSDKGAGWTRSPFTKWTAPVASSCTSGNLTAHGMESHGNVTIATATNGNVCTTTDGGESWTDHKVADELSTNPVWNGSAFHVWGKKGGKLSKFSSSDGLTWTSTQLTPMDARSRGLYTVGVTVKGTFVATNEVWNGGYENQRFYRSADGVTWTVLPATAHVGSHPILKFISGAVPANLYCTGQ